MPSGLVNWTSGVRNNKIGTLSSVITSRARANVDAAAEAMRTLSAQLAPVDTGSLQASIYVTNGETSDYASRAGEAESRNPGVEILEEVRPEFVLSLFGSLGSDAYIAIVGVAAGHGIFNEFGTRYMAASPFMTPVAELVREQFVAGFNGIADV